MSGSSRRTSLGADANRRMTDRATAVPAITTAASTGRVSPARSDTGTPRVATSNGFMATPSAIASADKIKVVARFRPLAPLEVAYAGEQRCVKYLSNGATVDVTEGRGLAGSTPPASPDATHAAAQPLLPSDDPDVRTHRFSLQRMFGEDTTQEAMYRDIGEPIVKDVLKGYNGTVLAYGQTGSGKTFTMLGPTLGGAPPSAALGGAGSPDGGRARSNSTAGEHQHHNPHCDLKSRNRGIVPRVAETLFSEIEASPDNLLFDVELSFVEVYQERLRDLLDPSRDKLNLREDPASRSFYIDGNKEVPVRTAAQVLSCIEQGGAHRATASTRVNEHSSRSHSIVCLTVTTRDTESDTQYKGKLFLVDLAGSEKVSKTHAVGERLDEAKLINKSLATLALVISKLEKVERHIPYRDSKLTKLLQDSLGGNSRTALIVCCSPSVFNAAETVSTLRFGSGASNITNHAVVNKEETPEELRAMLARAEAEIRMLRLGASPPRAPKPASGADDAAAAAAEAATAAATAASEQSERQLRLDLAHAEKRADAAESAADDQRVAAVASSTTAAAAMEHVASLQDEVDAWAREYAALSRQCGVQQRQLAAEKAGGEVVRKAFHQAHEALSGLQQELQALRPRVNGLAATLSARSMAGGSATADVATSPGHKAAAAASPAKTNEQTATPEGQARPSDETVSTGDSPAPDASPAYLRRAVIAEKRLADLEASWQELIYENGAWKLELEQFKQRLALRQERVENLKHGLALEKQNVADQAEAYEAKLRLAKEEHRTALAEVQFWREECQRYKDRAGALEQQRLTVAVAGGGSVDPSVPRDGSLSATGSASGFGGGGGSVTPGTGDRGLSWRFFKHVRGGKSTSGKKALAAADTSRSEGLAVPTSPLALRDSSPRSQEPNSPAATRPLQAALNAAANDESPAPATPQ